MKIYYFSCVDSMTPKRNEALYMVFDFIWQDSPEYFCPSALFAHIYTHIDDFSMEELIQALQLVYLQLKNTNNNHNLLEIFQIYDAFIKVTQGSNKNKEDIQTIKEYLYSTRNEIKTLLQEICWNWVYHAKATYLIEYFEENWFQTFNFNYKSNINNANLVLNQIQNKLLEVIHKPGNYIHWDCLAIDHNSSYPLIEILQKKNDLKEFPSKKIFTLSIAKSTSKENLISLRNDLKQILDNFKHKVSSNLQAFYKCNYLENYTNLQDNLENLTQIISDNNKHLSQSHSYKNQLMKILSQKEGFIINYTLHCIPIKIIPEYYQLNGTFSEDEIKNLQNTLKEDPLYESWIPVISSDLIEYQDNKTPYDPTINN
ncbi:MAG: hypothetical protein ACEPOW_02710 [Bacteroidales bacterium]